MSDLTSFQALKHYDNDGERCAITGPSQSQGVNVGNRYLMLQLISYYPAQLSAIL